MADHLTPSAGHCVAVHLLDSSQGHSLQTWRFVDRQLITIGRGDDNDIALADPHVSRAHAKLIQENGTWTLISTGRHGTLVEDRAVSEYILGDRTLFRLGGGGPMLRFDTHEPDLRRSETIDQIDTDLFSMLEIDEMRKQQEVDQITANAVFQELQQQSQRRREVTMQPDARSSNIEETV
jgi:pSer/pThr/pTyr-binding forkhead associated (FHA) protein